VIKNAVVKNATQLETVLLDTVKGLGNAKVLTNLGYWVKHRIEDRTVKENVGMNGQAFPGYSTTPTYISKSDRPAPRGGINTPQTKRKVRAWNKRVQSSLQTSVSRNTSGRGGKSMYFPGGYRQYKAALYGTRRNLTKTSRMLANLSYKAEPNHLLMYFAGDESNSKAVWNDEATPFFGVGLYPEEATQLQKAWEGFANAE